jgi:hypothetical protein
MSVPTVSAVRCYFPMTKAEILREQARILRDLATSFHAKDIKELLLHLAEQCDQLAVRVETDFASNGF